MKTRRQGTRNELDEYPHDGKWKRYHQALWRYHSKAASEVYQVLNGQAAQNSSMLYTCLCQSITKEVSTKASNNSARYKLVLNPGAVNQEFREDGPCFLKAIIDEYYTNTTSNTAVARRSLARLNEYMKTVPQSNITEFNQAVQANLQELEAASETTTDLVVNLFNGYMEAEETPFCRYVTNLYEQWIDRRLVIAPDRRELMTKAENYYKDAVKVGRCWLKLDKLEKLINSKPLTKLRKTLAEVIYHK